jgi:hypothetical protein
VSSVITGGRKAARSGCKTAAQAAVEGEGVKRVVSAATVALKGKPPIIGNVDVGPKHDRDLVRTVVSTSERRFILMNKEGLLPPQGQSYSRSRRARNAA